MGWVGPGHHGTVQGGVGSSPNCAFIVGIHGWPLGTRKSWRKFCTITEWNLSSKATRSMLKLSVKIKGIWNHSRWVGCHLQKAPWLRHCLDSRDIPWGWMMARTYDISVDQLNNVLGTHHWTPILKNLSTFYSLLSPPTESYIRVCNKKYLIGSIVLKSRERGFLNLRIFTCPWFVCLKFHFKLYKTQMQLPRKQFWFQRYPQYFRPNSSDHWVFVPRLRGFSRLHIVWQNTRLFHKTSPRCSRPTNRWDYLKQTDSMCLKGNRTNPPRHNVLLDRRTKKYSVI